MIPGIDCCDCCHIITAGKTVFPVLPATNDLCHTLPAFPGLPYYELFFMKRYFNRLNVFCKYSTVTAISFLFISCEFYNFSAPQPYDKEDIYHFPDELLGKWKAKDTVYGVEFTVPADKKDGYHFNTGEDQPGKAMVGKADGDSNYYCIYRDYMIMIFSERKKILAGAWPKLNSKNEFVYQPEGFGRLEVIVYDSLKKPVDTVSHYIISGNRIYERDMDRFLLRGYAYNRVKDTITILQIDSNYIDLGKNAFLRKLTDSLYIFNINNSVLSLSEGENWWRLIVLEIAATGQVNQWECSNKTGELACMFYDRPSKYDQFYFDCRWSAAEILRLMKEGYFEKTAVMERLDK